MIIGSVNLMPERPIAEIVEWAQEAERLGYQRCWVYDEGLATRDVYVTIAAIAAATSRILVGPGITNAYTRHVSTTAAAIASIDELSGGRAFLGVGAGGSLTLGPLGVDRSSPLVAVRDTIDGCRALFGGAPVTMERKGFTLDSARLSYARTDIEIWLAGRGPKMLALGGEIADGVYLDFLHKDTISDAVARVRSSGRPVKLSYSTMIVTDERDLPAVKPHLTYRLVDSPEEVKRKLGIFSSDVEAIRNAMAAGGPNAAAEFVRDEWVVPFIIFGTESECANELSDIMAQHSIDEYLLPVLDPHTAIAAMTMVAEVLRAG